MDAVGADDGLDEFVADDILLAEVTEGDAFDFAQGVQGFDEAGAFVSRKL